MNAAFDISRFIKEISGRLPIHQQVGSDRTYFMGAELKLTGITTLKGKPILDDGSYAVEMPILKKLDHESALRRAWLAHGIQGIANYLEPYIGREQAKLVKETFMSVDRRRVA